MTEPNQSSLAEKAYELAFKYEKQYGGGCQCAVAALQDALGMKNDDTFKAATALSGGGGSLGDGACSGYTGGLIFLSQLMGRERSNFADPEGYRYKVYAVGRKLHDKFIAEYGTVICRDILMKRMGRYFYIPDPDEFAKYLDAGGHDKVCNEILGNACKWTVEIIMEENLLPKGTY